MKKILLFFYCSLLPLSTVSAQWIRCGGPALKDEVTSFASNKQGFYAASGFGYYFSNIKGGLYRTNDNGFHWKDITPPVQNNSISALVTIGDYLFAAAYGEGLFRTSDGGNHWISTSSGITNTLITALSKLGTDIFAGTEGGGIFKSADSGKTWKPANNGLTRDSIGGFSTIGDIIFVSSFGGLDFSGRSSDIFRSTDHGENWTPMHHWKTGGLGTLASVGSNLFALFDNLYQSSDSGTTWVSVDALNQQLNVAEYARNLASINGDLFIIVTSGHEVGVHVSRDTGKTWSGSLGPGDAKSLGAMNDTLVIGSAEGLWFSVDHGYHWFSNPNVASINVVDLMESGGILFAAGAGNIYRSSDKGETWYSSNNGINGTQITSFTAKDSELLAVGGSIWKSTNNGISWSCNDTNFTDAFEVAIAGNNSLIAISEFSSLDARVFLSTDDGISWTPKPEVSSGRGMTAVGTEMNNVFVGNNGSLYSSTDNGQNWMELNIDPISYFVYAITSLSSYVFIAGYESGGASSIMRSSDNGSTWKIVSNNFPANFEVKTFHIVGKAIFAANNGVFVSTNTGDSWKEIDDGLPQSPVYALTDDGTYLFATTNFGVYRRLLSDFGVSAVKEVAFSEILLYPNPATSLLSIRNAPENLAGISILNVFGEKVMDIAAPHSSEFTIDISKLPAGMYYARFAIANSVEVRKIIKQ
jgi:photosystem II stability/assembly factor-like uncharacterized protein